jgi:hypothetical protein
MKFIMLASLIAPAAAFTGARTSATRYAATRAFSGSSSVFANPKGTSRHVRIMASAVVNRCIIVTNTSSLLLVNHVYVQCTSIWKLVERMLEGSRSNFVPILPLRPQRTSVHSAPGRRDTDMREAHSIGERWSF